MEVQGSDNSVLDRDISSQLVTLFTKVNDPTAFSGPFEEALKQTIAQSQAIIAKIAAGQKPTAEELKKFKTVCKAVEIGTNGWKTDIEKAFPAPRDAAVQTVLDSLEIYKNQVLAAMNCAGTASGGVAVMILGFGLCTWQIVIMQEFHRL